MKDWLETQVGPLTLEQYQRAVQYLKRDLQQNNNVPGEQVEQALELFELMERIRSLFPACATVALYTSDSAKH